jgi:hypothetical protein
MKKSYLAIVALVALVVAGCGGGGGHTSTLPAPSGTASTAPQSHGTATAQITIKIPAKTGASALKKKPAYVSPDTGAVDFVVNSGAPIVVPVVTSGPNCTLNAGVYTCTAEGQIPAGTNESIVVSTYQSSAGTGTPLSTNTITQTITPNVANPLTVTLNGVVNSVVLNLSAPGFSIGTSGSVNATVSAKDAAGDTIVGPGSLVDSSGNSVTLALTDDDTSGATSVGAPTGNVYPINYTGVAAKSPTLSLAASGATTVTQQVRIDSAVINGDFTVAAGSSNAVGSPWYVCSVGHQGFAAGGLSPNPSPVPSPSEQPVTLATPRATPSPGSTPFAQLQTAVPAGFSGSVTGGYTTYAMANAPFSYGGAIGICQDIAIPAGTPSLHVQVLEVGDDNFVNSDAEADLYTTPASPPHADGTLITGAPVATLFAEDNCWDASAWEQTFLSWPAGGGTGTVLPTTNARWSYCPVTVGGAIPAASATTPPSSPVTGAGGVWRNNTYAIPAGQIGGNYTLFLGTYRGSNTFAGGPSSTSAAYYTYAYFTGVGIY